MIIVTIEGVEVRCKECYDNKAMDGFEYCCVCAAVEGLI